MQFLKFRELHLLLEFIEFVGLSTAVADSSDQLLAYTHNLQTLELGSPVFLCLIALRNVRRVFSTASVEFYLAQLAIQQSQRLQYQHTHTR